MATTTGKLRTIPALALLLLAGCVSAPPVRPAADAAVTTDGSQSVGAPPPGAGEAGAKPAPVTTERPRNTAATSLQTTAEQQRAAGEPERAAATLERALRIDPKDPSLWLSLAEIRLEQGDRAQAAQLARRAETLAAPGSDAAARARALAERAGGG